MLTSTHCLLKQLQKDCVECSVRPVLSARLNAPHTLPLPCRDLGKLFLAGCKLWIGGNLHSKLIVSF